MPLLLLLSQAVADPSGTAIWLQLIMQGGALVLLGYIIIRLAPDMVREARTERESRDAVYTKTIDSLQLKFETRNDILVNAIDKQTDALRGSIGQVCRYQNDGQRITHGTQS